MLIINTHNNDISDLDLNLLMIKFENYIFFHQLVWILFFILDLSDLLIFEISVEKTTKFKYFLKSFFEN